MPRKARIDAPGTLYHIIARGIERRPNCNNNVDRDNFVERLSRIVTESDTAYYAWALIPNHFHLLLRTILVPISTVMRRLPTGYAVSFNHRHQHPHGHLFQNRYKSILCQQEPYLLELVRYIHLNPFCVGIVEDQNKFDTYAFSGRSRLTDVIQDDWQVVVCCPVPVAWGALKSRRRNKNHLKGDERLLRDSAIVEKVLDAAQERLEHRYRLSAAGVTFNSIVEQISQHFNISTVSILAPRKQPQRVMARSVAAYISVRQLGMTGTEVSKRLEVSQSAVSRAVERGEALAAELSISMLK